MLSLRLPIYLKGADMFLATMLMRLFLATGIVAGAMTLALVVYGNILPIREDDQLYLSKGKQMIIASEQRKQLRWLKRLIYIFTAITAVFLLASAGLWVWIGLQS
jgi:hypothetical protein